jgi:sugar-specific transcriptional regulator TrmB
MLEEKLCQIGFTRNESRVYLELLKIGPQAVSVVAKKSSINRTTAYAILKSLEIKGLVSSYGNGNIRYFVASDPNILVGFLDRKCRTLDYHREELLTMVPQFRKLISNYEFKKPVIRYFEGMEGVKYLMSDSDCAGGVLYSYCPAHKWVMNCDFFRNMKNAKIVLPDTLAVREMFENLKSVHALYLPLKRFEEMFENQINIYNDRVVIIHMNSCEEYGIMIESREFYRAQKSIFETLWKQYENKQIETGDFVQGQ